MAEANAYAPSFVEVFINISQKVIDADDQDFGRNDKCLSSAIEVSSKEGRATAVVGLIGKAGQYFTPIGCITCDPKLD